MTDHTCWSTGIIKQAFANKAHATDALLASPMTMFLSQVDRGAQSSLVIVVARRRKIRSGHGGKEAHLLIPTGFVRHVISKLWVNDVVIMERRELGLFLCFIINPFAEWRSIIWLRFEAIQKSSLRMMSFVPMPG
jgi:hypothetical protein